MDICCKYQDNYSNHTAYSVKFSILKLLHSFISIKAYRLVYNFQYTFKILSQKIRRQLSCTTILQNFSELFHFIFSSVTSLLYYLYIIEWEREIKKEHAHTCSSIVQHAIHGKYNFPLNCFTYL